MYQLRWILPLLLLRLFFALVPKETRTLLTHHQVADLRRIAVIGDLHGDAFCAQRWVEHLGLVNFTAHPWEWTGDNHTLLVFMGDYIDRGPLSSETLWLVKNMTERWSDRVVAILGNHELYLLEDQARGKGGGRFLDYSMAVVHPGEFGKPFYSTGSFTTEDTDVILPALYEALDDVYEAQLERHVFMGGDKVRILIFGRIVLTLVFVQRDPRALIGHYVRNSSVRLRVEERLREWQDAYLQAYKAGTELGDWLQQLPVMTMAGRTVFVHAGMRASALAIANVSHPDDLAWVNQALRGATAEELETKAKQGCQFGGLCVDDLVTYRG
jgi:hypothetical protein